VVGIVLAIALLVLYGAALIAVFRVPFRAFGVLVAGMAVHNILLMALLRLETPGVIIRVLQSWKEGILILLAALVVQRAWRAWRAAPTTLAGPHRGMGTMAWPRLVPMDWLAGAFAMLLLIYLVMPAGVLHNQAGYTQRVIEFRQLFLIPLLYLYGRVFWPARREDLTWAFRLILGAAGVVGLFGIIELWFVPTTTWLSWGVTLLSDWLHYAYNGPRHFPDFFFQTTSDGLFLRRMVSTYVSPLGIAYTGLLIVPMAACLFDARRTRLPSWFRGTTIALLVAAVLLSVTRLAIGLLVVEMVLLLILLRRRWLVVGVGVVAGLALLVLVEYVHFGPLLNRDLTPVAHRPEHLSVVPVGNPTSDPSLRGHLLALGTDIRFAVAHPLGMGLGNSIHQYGGSVGGGESAIFGVIDDAGLLPGLLYLTLFGMAVYHGFRAFSANRSEPLQAAIPLVAAVGGLILVPIALTSDIYGDFSVTFLFWWAAGHAVTARAIAEITRAGATSNLDRAPTLPSPRGGGK
jgi:hypothetical protein